MQVNLYSNVVIIFYFVKINRYHDNQKFIEHVNDSNYNKFIWLSF